MDSNDFKWPAIAIAAVVLASAAVGVARHVVDYAVQAEAAKAGLVQQVDKDTGKVIWVRDDAD